MFFSLRQKNLTGVFSLNDESFVGIYWMANKAFSWEVLSNLGMRWDSGSAGWTQRIFKRTLQWLCQTPPEHCIEWVNVCDLPRGLREARLIPCFIMFLMWLFQNLLNLPFIAIELFLLQILMSSSLSPPQSPISSAPLRLPLLWSVGMPEEQNKDSTAQNSFVLWSLLPPLLQGFRGRPSSHWMSMQVSNTLGWLCRELTFSDQADALTLLFIKIYNTWD